MSVGRVVTSLAAAAAVVGCTVVAIGMSRAAEAPDAAAGPTDAQAVATSAPVYAEPVLPIPSATSSSAHRTITPQVTKPAAPTHSRAATSKAAVPPRPPASSSARARTTTPKPRPRTTPVRTLRRGIALPLGYGTGSATRVLTVTASYRSSTVARLQPWVKAPGGGWLRYGHSVLAHVGEKGLTSSMSEFVSATPMGSFSLTQAFGRLSDPGTPLPYFRTTPADWWISQPGPAYNTHQRCYSDGGNGCGYESPSEHLYYETPYYNYAVVVDLPAGRAAYPHGSAVFLHVTDGGPTAGCIAIPQSNLVAIMRWLAPSTHPRILIGVA